MKKNLLTLLMLLSVAVLGFSPPIDKLNGVTAEIVDVQPKYEYGKPIDFVVKILNESGVEVRTSTKVYMNDDWVVDAAEHKADIPAGGRWERGFTGKPLPRCLAAFYPVHAEVTVTPKDGAAFVLHPIAVFETKGAVAVEKLAKLEPFVLKDGRYNLATMKNYVKSVTLFPTKHVKFFVGGLESESRGALSFDGGNFTVHPPWKKIVEAGSGDGAGTGTVEITYRLTLPAGKSTRFESAVRIRHNASNEPPSDGVEFSVAVKDGQEEKTIKSLFTDTKSFVPFTCDLSAYAGKTVDLIVRSGPGPKYNTICDSGTWQTPVLLVGEQPQPIGPDYWSKLEGMAKTLLDGGTAESGFAFDLKDCRAAVVPGEEGIVDGVIGLRTGNGTVYYRGFAIEINKNRIGRQYDGRWVGCKVIRRGGDWVVQHAYRNPEGDVPFEVVFSVRDDVMTMQFGMPGVDRDKRGEPRFTHLSIGPGTERPWRIYAGFGNVMEDLQAPFRLRQGGFGLSTRHVGVDYRNGVSVAMASDYFPDYVNCVPDENLFALAFHNDALFYLAPSGSNAYDAAKKYSRVNGFKASPGMAEIMGRQCLDQWGGSYVTGAEDVLLAGKYGLNHSVFVKHVWQRWGYDYRLPEIYPPAGGLEPFKALADSCKSVGILFSPHDNYIDFYPDAKGYSYDHIIFNEDGTPQRAWYNKGRKAQSYRWLPHAFKPWMVENMKLMRDGYGPDSLFIDVFTAITPRDYYDRDGRLHTSKRMAKEWADAFDTCRDILKAGSPMISECGHDGLIGSLDAGQSDHYPASNWGAKASAMDRTPWHDIVTHGKMVLFAGGLGGRYSKSNIDGKRGYGSDDYFSNTVLGGRNPMSDGPFSITAVRTFWTLHDVCDWLARNSFDSHDFIGNVCRQHTVFGDGKGRVWANRGEGDWKPEGAKVPGTLGLYGFWVETPVGVAGAYDKDGVRAGYSRVEKDGVLTIFADARPKKFGPMPQRRRIAVTASPLREVSRGVLEFDVDTNVQQAGITGQYVYFVHLCHPSSKHPESIAAHGGVHRTNINVNKVGKYQTVLRVEASPGMADGRYTIRFGMYDPRHGSRLYFEGPEVVSGRAFGGEFEVKNGVAMLCEPTKEEKAAEAKSNYFDFGDVRTNGSVRVVRDASGACTLTPLPGSLPFSVELDLSALGLSGKAFDKVECVDAWTSSAREPKVVQQGNKLSIDLTGDSFAYKLTFK